MGTLRNIQPLARFGPCYWDLRDSVFIGECKLEVGNDGVGELLNKLGHLDTTPHMNARMRGFIFDAKECWLIESIALKCVAYKRVPWSMSLLEYVATMQSPAKLGFLFSPLTLLPYSSPHLDFLVVRQPLKQCEGKGTMEELQQLATATLCGRLHTYLKALVEECGGTYMCAPRKSYERCVQKVEQDCGGDYSRLLDVERATGLFEQAEDMLLCLRRLREGEGDQGQGERKPQDPPSPSSSSVVVHVPSSSSVVSPFLSSTPSPRALPPLLLRVLRCKDRLNLPLLSGYRDILLNVWSQASWRSCS